MIAIILIQLFWFSLLIIGSAALIAMIRVAEHKRRARRLLVFLRSAHPLLLLLISFAVGIALFVPVMLFGYVFEWPIRAVAVYYLTLVTLALIVGGMHAKPCGAYFLRSIRCRNRGVWLFRCVAAAVLILDFGLALKAGTPITTDSDSIFHMAKIQYYIQHHLTFTDPYAAYNGVVDWRYSANVLNGLQAVIGYLLHQDSPTVWFYSFAFYRFIVWISLFALTWAFVAKRHREQLPYLVLAIVPLLYNGYFFTNVLIPHVTAVIFISLLFIGLKLLFEHAVPHVLILSTVLIATCNALVAAEAFCFLGLLTVILLLAKQLTKKQVLALAAGMLVLLVPVLFSVRQPSQFAGILQLKTSLTNVHGPSIRTTQLGPLRVPLITFRFLRAATSIVDWSFFGMAALVGVYVVIVRRTRRRLRIVAFYVVTFAVLAVYNPIYTSLVGALWLINDNQVRQARILIGLAMLFYALLGLNPIVLTITQGHLMPWIFARFQDFNPLAFITPLLGVYACFVLLAAHWKISRQARVVSLLVIIAIAAQFPSNRLGFSPQRYIDNAQQVGASNAAIYQRIDAVRQYDAYIPKNSVVFSNDPDFLAFAPLTTRTSINMLAAPVQSSPALNYILRSRCQKQIFSNLRAVDLQAAKVNAVVLAPGNETGLGFTRDIVTIKRPADEPYQQAATRPYLHFEKQIGQNRVYKVMYNPALDTARSICTIPRGE